MWTRKASLDAILGLVFLILCCALALERYEAYRLLLLMDEFESNQLAAASLRTTQTDMERYAMSFAPGGEGSAGSNECVDCAAVKLKNADSWSCSRCENLVNVNYSQWEHALSGARAVALVTEVCGGTGKLGLMLWTRHSLCSEKRSVAIQKLNERTKDLHWALWYQIAQGYVGWVWFAQWMMRWVRQRCNSAQNGNHAKEKGMSPSARNRWLLEHDDSDEREWERLNTQSGPLRRRFGAGLGDVAASSGGALGSAGSVVGLGRSGSAIPPLMDTVVGKSGLNT